ncbi:MAG: hypothetical protein JWO05_104 [Gemmatimonadetes bacterium]|nr:hypothetical protein [Gemmatimonadota bacterium]
MPITSFAALPDNARVWIFASDRPLLAADAHALLGEADQFLGAWKAHGAPLACAREWRDDRFLVIGVDPTVEQASGCSIDGLFRALQKVERTLDTRLLAGGRVFYRDAAGDVQRAGRDELAALASSGTLTPDTPVLDPSITSAADYRARFERPLTESWAAQLLPQLATRTS